MNLLMQIISDLVYNLNGEYIYVYGCVSLRFRSSDFHMKMPTKVMSKDTAMIV